MKKFKLLLGLLTAVIILFSFKNSTTSVKQQVNPILGDISFVNKFGYLPDASTNNELRIKTHLEYVENLLRQKDVSPLTNAERNKRNHILDLLHTYWTAGIFPGNYDFPEERVPCFIDKEGKICAVGYLVEQTAGRQIADQINSKHKYERIFEMKDEAVDNWIASSGLTKEECAMIQPTYGPPPVYSNNYISPEYGVTSAILSGINLSLNTMNGIQISRGAKNDIVPVIGLITGVGQVVLGIGNFPKEEPGMYATTNESQKVLSMVNIGFGTTTLILSTWNLIANRSVEKKAISWNIYGIPTGDNSVGLAFYFSRTF